MAINASRIMKTNGKGLTLLAVRAGVKFASLGCGCRKQLFMSTIRALKFLFICAFAVVLVDPVQSAEASFHHQKLTRWLKLYQSATPGTAEEIRCVAAIRAIGTNAVPQLIGRLSEAHLKDQQLAVRVFDVLGPLAAPAIPALTKLLSHTNPLVTILAASSLGDIGAPALPSLMTELTNSQYNIATLAAFAIVDLGTNATPAIAVFLHDLGSSSDLVRERAAEALGNLHLQPDIVVPALKHLLTDHSLMARCAALSSLGRFGLDAGTAMPGIVLLLNDPEEYVRKLATNAVCSIAPNTLSRRPATRLPD